MSRQPLRYPVDRRYLRHPTGMPIHFVLSGDLPVCREYLRNVSEGGLCFQAVIPVEPGSCLEVRIPVGDRLFEAMTIVQWCRTVGQAFEVGVQFVDADDQYAARLVEQLVYIEEYRQELAREQGRQLSSEEAAAEWIAQFAADFPTLS